MVRSLQQHMPLFAAVLCAFAFVHCLQIDVVIVDGSSRIVDY